MEKSDTQKFLLQQQENHEKFLKMGVLAIIAGPTAAGKSNIQKELIERNSTMYKVITCTTRLPRIGEQNGVDYHFIDRESFKKELSEGKYIESDYYHGQYYGTPKSELDPLFEGKDVVWIVTMPRALTIDTYLKDAFGDDTAKMISDCMVTMLITTPSWKQLEDQFIKNRGGSHGEFISRIKSDREFVEAHQHKFDHIIYNKSGQVSQSADHVQKIIRSKHKQEISYPEGVL